MPKRYKVSFTCGEDTINSVLGPLLGKISHVVLSEIKSATNGAAEPACVESPVRVEIPPSTLNMRVHLASATDPAIAHTRAGRITLGILRRTPDKARSLSEITNELEQEGYERGTASGILSALVQQRLAYRPQRGYYLPR